MSDDGLLLEVEGAMVSYAQWGEDVVLRRFFGSRSPGFYVDVGANDPVVDSVTQHFYLSGWRGINVEPLPAEFARLAAARPRDVNLNIAISDRSARVELNVNRGASGLSTLNPELVASYAASGHELEARPVQARRLDEIIREHAGAEEVDFLKVDVEGHEAAALSSVDFRRWRPRVVVVEAGYKPEAWEPGLLGAGYVLAGSHACNRYYVRSEEADRAHLLALPANVTDDYVRWKHARAVLEWEGLGPLLRKLVRELRRAKEAHPGAKRALKRAVRVAAPFLFMEDG